MAVTAKHIVVSYYSFLMQITQKSRLVIRVSKLYNVQAIQAIHCIAWKPDEIYGIHVFSSRFSLFVGPLAFPFTFFFVAETHL